MRASSLILLIAITLSGVATAAPAGLQLIQQDLFRLGFYYTGPADGVPGARTDAAIRAFQRSIGADPDGTLSAGQRTVLAREAERVQRPRAWPVDESGRDPGFAAMRRGLLAAVMARDARGVAVFFAADATLDFGGGSGPGELVRRLGDPTLGPDLWAELETILSLGAVQQGAGRFCMPYVWCAERVAEQVGDGMTAWVVAADAVLLAAPDADAEPVEPLRYDVLEILGFTGRWARVRSLAGEDAWLHRSQYRTPYDHRILVRRVDGRWQVTAFVAGD